jgi:hypothetical protein
VLDLFAIGTAEVQKALALRGAAQRHGEVGLLALQHGQRASKRHQLKPQARARPQAQRFFGKVYVDALAQGVAGGQHIGGIHLGHHQERVRRLAPGGPRQTQCEGAAL